MAGSNALGRARLVATCYAGSPIAGTQLSLFGDETEEQRRTPYKAVVTTVHDTTGEGGIDMLDVADLFRNGENTIERMQGNGDFRSAECLELLDEADIVVTNPPFSLWREYVSLLVEHGKRFIIIGSQNAITYKEVFKLLQDNRMWLGYGFSRGDAYFSIPRESARSFAQGVYDEATGLVHFRNCAWYTNLDIKKRHEEMILVKRYKPNAYPRYENYDAIEVAKLADIPCDYPGIMGVPITFMDKYSPDQFVILGRRGDLEWAENECDFYTPPSPELQAKYKAMNRTWRVQNTYYLDESGVPKVTYGRIFIRYTQGWIDSHPEDFKGGGVQ